MKVKYLFLILGIVLLIGNVNAFNINYFNNSGNCYQESVNISTSCGGLNTGSYYCEGIWGSVNNCSATIDGNWNTYGYNNDPNNATIYINYSKPTGALNTSTWNIKDIERDENNTLPQSCWSYNSTTLILKSVSYDSGNKVSWYCFNGSWYRIASAIISGNIYEESMNWNLSTSITENINFTGNENITRYLNIPSNTILTNGFMDLSSIDNLTSNISIYIGNNRVWNYTGSFNTTNKTSNLANSINNYLTSCTYFGGYCNVPFIFHSDTSGILNYNNLIFNNTGFLQNSINYNTSTYESSNELFTLNLTYDTNTYNSISANFTYNNTIYQSTILTYPNYKIITNNISIPLVNSSVVNLFYWTIALTNSTGGIEYYNSSINNQTVNKGTYLIANSSCPAGTSPMFNFTSLYEQNLSNINLTNVNYNILYGLSGNPNAYTLNGSLTNIGEFSICLNNSQSYYNIGYGEIQYSNSGMVNRRYYIFSNTRATNETINIPLYSLSSSDSTSFLFTAQTTTLIPYSNNYIGLLRWYPELNEYRLVEMAKTDDKGQSILHIKTDDVDYKIALYSETGTLIKMLNSVRFICQTNPCTYQVSVDPNPLDLTEYTNIQGDLTFNPTTKIFTFTWNDPSQSSQTMNLTVYKGDEIICSSSAQGYTGVIYCDVSDYYGILTANVIRTASPGKLFAQSIQDIKQSISDVSGGKEIGLFIGAILLIIFAMIGSFNPVIVVILGIIALIPLFLIGGITSSILMAIGVLGGVIIHFIKRGQQNG